MGRVYKTKNIVEFPGSGSRHSLAVRLNHNTHIHASIFYGIYIMFARKYCVQKQPSYDETNVEQQQQDAVPEKDQ